MQKDIFLIILIQVDNGQKFEFYDLNMNITFYDSISKILLFITYQINAKSYFKILS